jgi:hypothetical protein
MNVTGLSYVFCNITSDARTLSLLSDRPPGSRMMGKGLMQITFKNVSPVGPLFHILINIEIGQTLPDINEDFHVDSVDQALLIWVSGWVVHFNALPLQTQSGRSQIRQ